jgi:hypothetical protein
LHAGSDHADELGLPLVCHLPPSGAGEAPVALTDAQVTAQGKIPLNQLPQLSSLPGAPATLFMDFDGSSADKLTAFSRDSDRTTFSDAEVNEIREVFERVSEFFSPFKINVTTVDPKTYQALKTSRIIITDDDGGAWAYVGSFRAAGGGFGRVGDNGWGDANNMAMVIAHEAGHTFGLDHQSVFDSTGRETQDYNPGNATKGPIMGAPYGSERQLWWDGPTYSANPSTYQDDLSVLASNANRFGYRADDVPNSLSQALELTPVDNSYSFAGLITRTADRDAFRFKVTESSRVTIRGDVANNGSAMLNLKLQVYDSEGTLISTRDTGSMGETVSLTLEPGDYSVVVASHGDYGDVGQYRLLINSLPTVWLRTLVGGGTSTATASAYENVIRVDGAGRDIGSTADGFQFVHQPLTGDGQIQTEIQSLDENNTLLRAGLMIRSTTVSSSAYVALLYVPDQGVRMSWRDAGGESAVSAGVIDATAPLRLRLERKGNEFIGQFSLDGNSWIEVGRHVAPLDPSARIGLAVASRGSGDGRVFFANTVVGLSATAGDIDGDGVVDLVDFGVLKDNFGLSSVTRAQGDLTGDGRVNLSDFGVLKLSFAQDPLDEVHANDGSSQPGTTVTRPTASGTHADLLAEAALGLAFADWAKDELAV